MSDHCKFCGAVTSKNCRSDADYQSCAFLADIASDEAWAAKFNPIFTALADVAGWLENEGRAKHARHIRDGIAVLAKTEQETSQFRAALEKIKLGTSRVFDEGEEREVEMWMDAEEMQDIARAALSICSLATTPAETQKPETGESHHEP